MSKRTRRTLPRDPSRVVGYVRASKEDQEHGPDAQRAALAAWCSANGAQLVAVHEDLGISGGAPIDRRPGLMNALAALDELGAGVLLVAKRDRLARDVYAAAMVERLVERSQARLLAADGTGNGEGPEASLLRNIVNAFAEYERALIRSRTRVALAAKKAKRERTGSIPYGARLSPDGVHLELDPTEAAVVARARALRAQGLALRAVGEVLVQEGHRPRGGKDWHPQTLARIVAA